ncbi:ABC transporter permease/M1 family aminopeptidase [Polaribacter dokdonensis]|uniref:Aminopeptidase N n=1 Tax=Polaribacter dokdonensis DSW-5 TaxID=1300348 RepID=A0A0M9CJ82_9FLAO|nr:M1 family aminopeptidase [Polaribacter dokdonensis]KOY53095.1 Aminopeptidase N [Polaribacter dokdonensis DSW-5]SEE57084.1 Peptidase family M1 [Polaribacter dokdonensis DSW-5]
MWYEIFKFEIQYRIKRPDTYVFFLFIFLFSIIGVDFVFQGSEMGLMKRNSPLIIAKTMGAITNLCMILASMIMGVSVLRDFEYEIESLLFSTPIKKRDYLLGRFLGAFTVLLFVFTGIILGMMLGEFMPWISPDEQLAFNAFVYIKTFLMVTLPTLFFGAALFFVTGALTRNLIVVYTQGVILFVVFLLTKAITNDFWQAIFDPFSLTTTSYITKSWSVLEKSTQELPFIGAMLFNKLFWVVLGIFALIYGYKKFNFNLVKEKKSRRKQVQKLITISASVNSDIEIPKAKKQYGLQSKWAQLKEFSWFYFISICKQPSFWGIVICGMIIILVNSVNLGTVYGVDSYPATYFIVEELQETSYFFFIIILVFYSGELVWKERVAKLNLIYDATPMSSFVRLAGKFIGLNLIYVVLIVALICSGIVFQTLSGYYNYEFQVYFNGFFLEILPLLSIFTCLAFFIQSLVNNKFVGIILVIIFSIVNVAIAVLGFDHDLHFFGGSSLGAYSDMNGYGHFLQPYLIIKLYWFLFGILLLIIGSLISVRGNETNLLKRIKIAKYKFSKPLIKFTDIILFAFIIIGGFIFYNTNILNEYWSNSEATEFRVAYEKELKQFEYIAQPKIVDVNLQLELYPSKRDYTVEGYYMLKNTSIEKIKSIHIQKLLEENVTIDSISFEGGFTTNNQYKKFDYSIFNLKNALQPGDSVKMYFKQSFTTKGFEQGNSNSNIVYNGTFFNNEQFPTLGYNKKYELQDEDERREHNLSKRSRKANIDDPKELVNARSGGDSDGIHFEMIIGTSKDQTALVPGDLLRKWTDNNRNYFHYKTTTPIINFYAIVSADYEIKKDKWMTNNKGITEPVDLEIYYQKGHKYNIDRMMRSMKASLDYYSNNFSRYQYQQLRIMEFPRYATFAQSFPGTIPFSESIGFVLDIDDEKDLDMAFYVTAHEVAHQWFAMQVEAANVQGQLMVLETLSQYAAIMVLKQQYSEEKVQQFLTLQMDKYKEGIQKESKEEPSLALVENQDYVYYAKGAINMYEFQKAIGEKNVNKALKRFLEDWNTTNGKLKMQTDRYATTQDLLGYFREVTPVSQQHIVTDLFEKVTPVELNL